MTALATPRYWTRTRLFALVGVASSVALFIGANAHLVYVSFASKPECVLQQNTEGVAIHRAAKPSC
ncbi:hypothetical protein [Pseudoruegeria sp. SK021]|uniref:hypothetical protein n=1 Tax=Pseudoruegeria sp. SK021 TaxID=1933035 RepID=UPI000A2237F8|nr:hypothetical protein [Pseudoruegeria sp. SK021]OSP54103.1 hypothetical protein BV911_14135 [Pseudoruegeria sp. SK021]